MLSSAGLEGFKIRMLDKVIMKTDEETGEQENYFEFEVLQAKQRVHKVEKRYKDFQAFE